MSSVSWEGLMSAVWIIGMVQDQEIWLQAWTLLLAMGPKPGYLLNFGFDPI